MLFVMILNCLLPSIGESWIITSNNWYLW